MDPILNVMLLIKNAWTLTGDFTGSNITFSTRWYDSNIQMPQITISPSPSRQLPLTTGIPLYQSSDNIYINIWVRPIQDSNRSIGWAKNAIYQLRQEIEKLLISGANIGAGTSGTPYTSKEYVFLSGWRDLTEVEKETARPIIFRQECVINNSYFKSWNEI